ncbi:MAG: hypothetical protein KHW79_04450 [Clostridiales bacterium]|nr:hypothetical protein [Clostridiales bacterium]
MIFTAAVCCARRFFFICLPGTKRYYTPKAHPQKVGSKPERRERACKRAAKAKCDFLRRGGMTERYEKSPAIRLGILNGA